MFCDSILFFSVFEVFSCCGILMTPYPYVGKVDQTLCQVQATFIQVLKI